jgi:hypothetical protein
MNKILDLTHYWLSSIVVDLDLCPFARRPFENDAIKLIECSESDPEEMSSFFFDELDNLNETDHNVLATTLIIYSSGPEDFREFNDFIGDMEASLEQFGLDEHFQLVMFHPKFLFDGLDPLSTDHLINRSPYPTLQIIRSEDIANANFSPEKAEELSRANGIKLQNIGTEKLKKLFYYLYESGK